MSSPTNTPAPSVPPAPALPQPYRDQVADWLSAVAGIWAAGEGSALYPAAGQLAVMGMRVRATPAPALGAPSAAPVPTPATAFPLDDNLTLVPGDVVRSLAPNHRNRHYLVMQIDEPRAGSVARAIWGRRYNLARAKAEGPVHWIKHAVCRIGHVDTATGTATGGKSAVRAIPCDTSSIEPGDLVEDTKIPATALWRNRYQVTRLGGPSSTGRILFGQRVARGTGQPHGPEVQITWPVRKAAPGKGDAKQ